MVQGQKNPLLTKISFTNNNTLFVKLVSHYITPNNLFVQLSHIWHDEGEKILNWGEKMGDNFLDLECYQTHVTDTLSAHAYRDLVMQVRRYHIYSLTFTFFLKILILYFISLFVIVIHRKVCLEFELLWIFPSRSHKTKLDTVLAISWTNSPLDLFLEKKTTKAADSNSNENFK